MRPSHLFLVMARDQTPSADGFDAGHQPIATILHKVSRVIPSTQRLRTLPPSTSAGEALKVLAEGRFSQVPVVDTEDAKNTKVMGIFSYSSFARGITTGKVPSSLNEVPIEDFLERDIGYAPATEDVRNLITLLERHQTVLVGHAERVTAIVTRGDLARYLYSIAEPFMLLEEIERATRALMECAVSPDEMPELIRVALEEHHAERSNVDLPTKLTELTITELRLVLIHGKNYPLFKSVFRAEHTSARGKYEGVPAIRNDLLHFRGEWTPERRNVLLTCRDWLERRVPTARMGA